MIEDKVSLARKRAELVEKASRGPLPIEDRVRIQGELSVVNAKIKALNTTAAAQFKAAADRRKIAGLTESQANAARAKAKLIAGAVEDEDLARTAEIDAWIIAVLLRGGVKVHRASDGNLDLLDAPAKWVGIVAALCDGLHATSRGEELPEITAAPKTRKRS